MTRKTQAGATVGVLAIAGGGALTLTLVVGIALLLVLVFALDGRSRGWMDAVIADHIDAEVSYGEVTVSLFRSFPDAEIHIDDVRITGREPFAGVELLHMERAVLAVDITSLFAESSRVRGLALHGLALDRRIDADGHDNLDIFRSEDSKQPDDAPSRYAIDLDDIDIEDLSLRYSDATSGLDLRLEDLDLRARGTVDERDVAFETHGQISDLSVRYGGVRWLHGADARLDGGVTYGQVSGALSFDALKMAVNALPLTLDGSVTPDGEAYEVDLSFTASEADFKALLSLVPDAYSASFEDVESAGTLSLKGTARGRYEGETYPAFDATLKVSDGSFAYPDLPTQVSRIGADVSVQHAQGPLDLTEIFVRSFSLSTGGAPFRGSATVRNPVTDPHVDATLKGRLDLEALSQALPDSGAPPGTGQLDVDLEISGRMSDFEAQNTDDISATGTVRAKDLRVDSEDLPVVLTVRDLDASLSPTQMEIRSLAVAYDDSDFSITGHFDNLLPYLLADASLTGAVALTSDHLDLRPFQGDEDAAEADQTEDEHVLVAIPENLDLGMTARVATLKTALFELSEVDSTVRVADASLQMSSLDAELAGGEISLSGSYTAPTAESADVDLRIDALRFDLVQTLTTFATLARIAPFLEGARGRFNSDFAVKTRLDAQGNPDLSLVSSAGSILPLDLNLESGVLVTTAKKIKGLESLRIDEALIRYAFEEGRIDIRPFETKLGDMPATVAGTAGVLDQTLELTAEIAAPTRALRGNPILDQAQTLLGDTVDIQVKISGEWLRPKVAIGLADGTLTDKAAEVVDEALKEAQDASEAILAKAREGADLIRDKAREAGEALRKEATVAGRKLKKEAGANPIKKALAVEAAKKLTAEADKAAKKLEREAGKAADKVLAEAEAEAEALLDRAAAESDKALKRR